MTLILIAKWPTIISKHISQLMDPCESQPFLCEELKSLCVELRLYHSAWKRIDSVNYLLTKKAKFAIKV